MNDCRIVAVEFSEEEWQYLRERAEQFGTSIQIEAREAVQYSQSKEKEFRKAR